MIEYETGDMLAKDVEALVNTVNCVGVMGRGIALQFKNAFPENYRGYLAACKQDQVQPGRMFVFETKQLTNPRFIINFPTKRHWRGKSRMEDIESGLVALADTIQSLGIRSIAIPPLGCGLGGLNWPEVRSRIESALGNFSDVRIVVFEPDYAFAEASANRSREVPTMSAGRAALIALMQRYLGGLLDPFISLLEVHKLMYFVQAAGEPLRLRYTKAVYGPYAENLRHVLNAVEGHLIFGYADGGDAPDKQLQLVPGATEEAQKFLEGKDETQVRLQRVSKLVEGFESPFGLELLATVHWVVDHERVKDVADVVALTYEWNERKKQFSRRQIDLAIQRLSELNWINDLSLSGTR